MQLKNITDPAQLKELSHQQLTILAKEIREFLVESISQTGGHLSSNLGVVELTMALHYVFDFKHDKLFIDVGHQAYVHKILTGRANQFSSLRQFRGLSGFQKFNESSYDHWESGHAGTALSGALGQAMANHLDNNTAQVVSLIGDGSIANGVSFEALNHIAYSNRKVIIVLNDNNMSISKNVGAFANILSRMRSSKSYRVIKYDIKALLKQIPYGVNTGKTLHKFKEFIKHKLVKSNYFTDFGLEYYGPVDGHDFKALINAFETVKNLDRAVVVHVVTTKGKGYGFSEQDDSGKWHGVAKFDIDSGENIDINDASHCSWSQAITEAVANRMAFDNDIMAITPAMINGSKLEKIFAKYPQRSIDCGIAEEHATTLAAGLALAGKKPFLAIYSTFLQRSYDQINHDICRMNLPVVIGIDRCGLVGEDGPTHHGVFDVGILRPVPNLVIAQPKDYHEAQLMINTAFEHSAPFAIRYPRGNVLITDDNSSDTLPIGTWTKTIIGTLPMVSIITYGPQVNQVIELLETNNIAAQVVNARFFKPIDGEMLTQLASTNLPVIVYETDQLVGGLATAIMEVMVTEQLSLNLHQIGIGDHYVEQGSINQLKKTENIDLDALLSLIKQVTHAS